MCRLFLSNKKAVKMIDKRYGILKYLDSLEKSCGGHGNGFILVKDGKMIFALKGVELKNEKVIIALKKIKYDWIIYHTRVASAGSKKDANCHPYWNESNTFALAMNGTVRDVGNLAKDIDITDTDMIFRMINKKLIDVEAVKNVVPNFIGFKDSKVWACSNGYSNGLKFIDKDGALAIASEFPTEFFKDYETMEDGFWWEGTEIKEKTYVHSTTAAYSYNYNGANYNWEEYYQKRFPSTAKETEKKIVVISGEKVKDETTKLTNLTVQDNAVEFDYTLEEIKEDVQRAVSISDDLINVYDYMYRMYDFDFTIKGFKGTYYFDVAENMLYLMNDNDEPVVELYESLSDTKVN